MAELDAIVGIYGAVDQAVQGNQELRTAVSQLLPSYQDHELHWYDDFQTWLSGAEAKAPAVPFPSLPAALTELATIEPRCRMRPRRLFAIAVAMQAFPEMRDPKSELGGLSVNALHVSTLAGAEGEQALALHGLLAEQASLPAVKAGSAALNGWWNKLVASAAADGLIANTAGMYPRPCSGRLVNVPNVAGPVAALETEFETDEIDFERATKFIEPANWKKCMPWFWCAMKRLDVAVAPGVYRYREVVSTDCANKLMAAFRAETELDFSFQWLPDTANPEVALTNYQMSPDRPLPGDLIRVDEGSLVVAKVGPGPRPLRITTTKRIQFSFPFSSQALATIMCALGYTDVVGDLLCCAASNPKQPGTSFPGEDPGRVRHGPVREPVPGGLVGAVGECVEECVAAAADWSRRASGGSYTIDELAQDMADTWVRAVRKGATAVEQGAKGTRPATRPRTRDRAEG